MEHHFTLTLVAVQKKLEEYCKFDLAQPTEPLPGPAHHPLTEPLPGQAHHPLLDISYPNQDALNPKVATEYGVEGEAVRLLKTFDSCHAVLSNGRHEEAVSRCTS